MDNQFLAERMKVVLASAYSLALKAQNYHWNVTGPHFIEYHRFFKEIYQQIHLDIDEYAEYVRILGMFAPASLSRFVELSRISDEQSIPTADIMISRFYIDNQKFIDILKSTHSVASEAKNPSLTSFLEERLQYHEKIGWMLNSLSG
jgi:starvation-inducible DNA-binding protein